MYHTVISINSTILHNSTSVYKMVIVWYKMIQNYSYLILILTWNVQGKRIENGVYLGPLGNLTFEGRLSWKNKILAFIFECVRIKIGPFGPLQIDFRNQDQREPGTKDPFFIWFYVDEEIAVAQGRGGGVAFWCRCRRVT